MCKTERLILWDNLCEIAQLKHHPIAESINVLAKLNKHI